MTTETEAIDRAAPGAMPAEQIIVVTGAAGRIGRDVIPLLRREGRHLRLVDISPPPQSSEGPDEWLQVSITDREALVTAFAGATAVVHLAGLSLEMPWAETLSVNIDGAQAVLESALRAGVRRLLLASSYHVVGYERPDSLRDTRIAPPRPDTYYGVSKAAMEALGSVFADRFGMSVISARIVSYGILPQGERGLAQWLSPADMARLIEAAIAREASGHRTVWAVSDNAPGWFPLEAGREIGYHPQDDAARVIEAHPDAYPGVDPSAPFEGLDRDSILGYKFVEPWALGEPRIDRPRSAHEREQDDDA